jgi:hypothetical protein
MVASQVIYMLANKPLCKVSKQKVDGSFLATLLETVAVVLVVVTWSSITEGTFHPPCLYAYPLTTVKQKPGRTMVDTTRHSTVTKRNHTPLYVSKDFSPFQSYLLYSLNSLIDSILDWRGSFITHKQINDNSPTQPPNLQTPRGCNTQNPNSVVVLIASLSDYACRSKRLHIQYFSSCPLRHSCPLNLSHS